eukprot:Polyplicarium_translucidae@DN104_c0_g1_i1.p1
MQLVSRLHFAGDEDNGEMSAWFILSSLGLYTMKPGSNYYNLGYPLFKEVKVKLFETKSVTIRSDCGGSLAERQCRIRKITGNERETAKEYRRFRVTADDLRAADSLAFEAVLGDRQPRAAPALRRGPAWGGVRVRVAVMAAVALLVAALLKWSALCRRLSLVRGGAWKRNDRKK